MRGWQGETKAAYTQRRRGEWEEGSATEDQVRANIYIHNQHRKDVPKEHGQRAVRFSVGGHGRSRNHTHHRLGFLGHGGLSRVLTLSLSVTLRPLHPPLSPCFRWPLTLTFIFSASHWVNLIPCFGYALHQCSNAQPTRSPSPTIVCSYTW